MFIFLWPSEGSISLNPVTLIVFVIQSFKIISKTIKLSRLKKKEFSGKSTVTKNTTNSCLLIFSIQYTNTFFMKKDYEVLFSE